jgi:hypothetical protein
MLKTPGTLELARRWTFSLGGDDERPWTAESTLVRVFSVSADMIRIGCEDCMQSRFTVIQDAACEAVGA